VQAVRRDVQHDDVPEVVAVDVVEVGGRRAVRQEGALTVDVDQHDDRARTPAPLRPHVDAGRGQLLDQPVTERVCADAADEAGGGVRGGGDRDVGRAAPARAKDPGGRVGPALERSVGPDDDVLDEVADDGQDEAAQPQQPPPQHPPAGGAPVATELDARPPTATAVKTREVAPCPRGQFTGTSGSSTARRTSKRTSQVRQR